MPINSAQQVGDEFLSILLIIELYIAADNSEQSYVRLGTKSEYLNGFEQIAHADDPDA